MTQTGRRCRFSVIQAVVMQEQTWCSSGLFSVQQPSGWKGSPKEVQMNTKSAPGQSGRLALTLTVYFLNEAVRVEKLKV